MKHNNAIESNFTEVSQHVPLQGCHICLFLLSMFSLMEPAFGSIENTDWLKTI